MISLDKIVSSAGEKGVIPIGIGVIIGYILVWAVHMGDLVSANATSIEIVKEKQRSYNEDVHKVDMRLSRIEWALKIKTAKYE